MIDGIQQLNMMFWHPYKKPERRPRIPHTLFSLKYLFLFGTSKKRLHLAVDDFLRKSVEYILSMAFFWKLRVLVSSTPSGDGILSLEHAAKYKCSLRLCDAGKGLNWWLGLIDDLVFLSRSVWNVTRTEQTGYFGLAGISKPHPTEPNH